MILLLLNDYFLSICYLNRKHSLKWYMLHLQTLW
jgi:hypothetical protein